jgi:hypothetical protein
MRFIVPVFFTVHPNMVFNMEHGSAVENRGYGSWW